MTSDFFDLFAVQEKQFIEERTDALIGLLDEWVPQYPFLRKVRTPSIALLTATVVPKMPLSDALLVAKTILWIFGVDDEADEKFVSPVEMQHKAAQWYLIANYGISNGTDEDDELTVIFLEIKEELSNYPLFEPFRAEWAFNVRSLIEAMAQEYEYGLQYNTNGAATLPSLHEYIRNGIYSVGFPPWALTVLIITRDFSVKKQFVLVEQAIEYAGAAIRLYNDLQTFDKELQESNINSIVIEYHTITNQNFDPLTKSDQFDESILFQARQNISRLADSYAQRCCGMIKKIHTSTGQMEEMLSRIVAFHAYFYGEHDYHTTALSEVNEMLKYGV